MYIFYKLKNLFAHFQEKQEREEAERKRRIQLVSTQLSCIPLKLGRLGNNAFVVQNGLAYLKGVVKIALFPFFFSTSLFFDASHIRSTVNNLST